MDAWLAVRADESSTLTRLPSAGGVVIRWKVQRSPVLARVAATAILAFSGLALIGFVAAWSNASIEDMGAWAALAVAVFVCWMFSVIGAATVGGWAQAHVRREAHVGPLGIRTAVVSIPWDSVRTTLVEPRRESAAAESRAWTASVDTPDGGIVLGRHFTEAEATALVHEIETHRPRGGVRDADAERALRELRQQAD